jgi:hypothetical protein
MKTGTFISADEPPHVPRDVVARGKAIYERDIRVKVELPENIGKVLVVDVDTGEYLMGDDVNADDDYEVALKAANLYSGHDRFGMRIGYNALDAAGGAIRKTYRREGTA